jgi:hypothetical protein
MGRPYRDILLRKSGVLAWHSTPVLQRCPEVFSDRLRRSADERTMVLPTWNLPVTMKKLAENPKLPMMGSRWRLRRMR